MASVLDRSQVSAAERSTAEPKPKASFYHPELNSLRFFAFLLVFVDHSLVISPGTEHYMYAGAYGVPVFFTLSAYLIISLLVREQAVAGSIKLRYFYMRRILRIWPLYLAVLLTGFLAGHVNQAIWMPRQMLVSYLLLAGNFYVARNGWADSPTSVLWSLSIEEQFYLVIPLIAKYLGSRGLRITCWVVAFSAFPALIYRGLIHAEGGDVIQVNPWVCFQFFGLGGLIALHPRLGIKGKQPVLRIGAALFGLKCFLSASIRFAHIAECRHPASELCYSNALVVLGSAAIFFAFLNYPAKQRSLPGYLGLISYGLYVFHPWCLELCAELRDKLPMGGSTINLLWNLASLSLTIAVAAVSFKLLERPTLKLKQRFEVVRTLRI